MTFEITEGNFSSYVVGGIIEINEDFLKNNGIQGDSRIVFDNIRDKSVKILIKKINNLNLAIEIHTCNIRALNIIASAFAEIKLTRVEVSEYYEDKFQYHTIIDNSQLKSFQCFDCTFYNGILFRVNSKIDSIYVANSKIDYYFAFINSASNKITLQSSNIDSISTDRNEQSSVTVDKIYIFQSVIEREIRIWETTFSKIHFHRINFKKRDSLLEHNNEIYISVPKDLERVDSIKITDSQISSELTVSLDKLNSFMLHNSTIGDCVVNFWAIDAVKLNNCTFSGYVYWGHLNHQKEIVIAEFQNAIFSGDFNLNDTWFKKALLIQGCLFQKYPSFFDDIFPDDGCKVDFGFSNLKNTVFQEVDFAHFNFKNFDIANAEFKDCKWPVKRSWLFERNLVFDETTGTKDVASLIAIKDIYAKLKTNFKNTSDHINYGRFHLSEQEVKREITRINRSWIEYWLLTFHKYISSYGENFIQPLLLTLIVTISFSILYLFSGFYCGNDLVQFQFEFDIVYFWPTLDAWCKSLVFCLRTMSPFPANPNFFLHSALTLPTTQTLELAQKLISIIFAASFTGALVKYLRK